MTGWAMVRAVRLQACSAWIADEARRAGVTLDAAAQRGLVAWIAERLTSCTKTVCDLGEPVEAFPVVTRLLAGSVAAWRRRTSAVLAHVARDARVLGVPPAIAHVTAHGERLQARTTTLGLEFANGVRWFYRTRDRSQGAWFQELCAALNASGLSAPLHVRRVLLREGCSWDEHVEAGRCTDPLAIRRYFVRAGMLVRLAERLVAEDLHARNVMMAGEYPVLIDVETLFNPVPPHLVPAHAALYASPIHSGLVGAVVLGAPGRQGIDASGFHPGGRLAVPIDDEDGPMVEDIAPTIPAPLGDHVDDLLAGWEEMDACLGRADLAAVLARVPELQRRAFAVPGAVYHAALVASLAPELLRSEQARDAWIATLGFAPLDREGVRDLVLPRRMEPVGDHPAAVARPAFTDPERRRRIDIVRTAIALRDDRCSTGTPREVANDHLGLAVELGDRLLALRFHGSSWHGVRWIPEAGLRMLGVLRGSLYDGTGGLAVVFALLARAANAGRFADAARAALATVPDDTPSLGVFGLGGAIYALAACAHILDDRRLRAEAQTYVAAVPRIEAPWEVTTGVAGFVLGASAVARPPEHAVAALHDAWLRGLGPARALAGGAPDCMPDVATGVACALARAGISVRAPDAGALAWRLALDPEATGPEPSGLLDRLDLALARYRATNRADDAHVIRACADAVVDRYRTTGRLFPATSIAERHMLAVIDGVPAVIHALLCARDPDVRSIRRLERHAPPDS